MADRQNILCLDTGIYSCFMIQIGWVVLVLKRLCLNCSEGLIKRDLIFITTFCSCTWPDKGTTDCWHCPASIEHRREHCNWDSDRHTYTTFTPGRCNWILEPRLILAQTSFFGWAGGWWILDELFLTRTWCSWRNASGRGWWDTWMIWSHTEFWSINWIQWCSRNNWLCLLSRQLLETAKLCIFVGSILVLEWELGVRVFWSIIVDLLLWSWSPGTDQFRRTYMN